MILRMGIDVAVVGLLAAVAAAGVGARARDDGSAATPAPAAQWSPAVLTGVPAAAPVPGGT